MFCCGLEVNVNQLLATYIHVQHAVLYYVTVLGRSSANICVLSPWKYKILFVHGFSF